MSASTGAIVVALARRAERRIVEQLREAGATSPAKTEPLFGLRWTEKRRLRRLLAAGAIREASPGAYYLNEAALTLYRQRRRRRGLFALGAALLTVLGVAGLSRK